MMGVADKAWARGFNVVRLNQRNCGGTEHLCATLYHSGLSADVDVVVSTLAQEGHRALVVAGYSLGGNLALKLAGEHGAAPPSWLRGVVAVSPVMDLPRCVDALEQPSNVIYQWNFVRNLKARMRRKIAAFPGRFSPEPLQRIRTVRDFDEAYTAPFFGFRDADRLLLSRRIAPRRRSDHGADADPLREGRPFRAAQSFADKALTQNPAITMRISPHGGHCAFVSARNGIHDGYWAEWAIVEFLAAHC